MSRRIDELWAWLREEMKKSEQIVEKVDREAKDLVIYENRHPLDLGEHLPVQGEITAETCSSAIYTH